MAERRMLAKSIIESDMFTDMPAESQMLYVRLILAADDDGFVSNPRTIMRGCGASNDAMLLLINKKFVLSFEKGDNFVYLIKHWRIHNYIKSDRYKASTLKELLRGVYYDENKAYSTTPGEGKTPVLPSADTECIQTGSEPEPERSQTGTEPEPQDRLELGKSKDRVSLEKGKERGRKEESEGKTLPADLSDPEMRISRIKHWKNRIQFMESQGYSAGGMYDLARAEGITAQEIDNFREET